MQFFRIYVLLATARGVLSALTASNAQPNLASPLSNAAVNGTGPNPLQRPKSYRIPNSPTTLIFIAYAPAPTLAPTTTFQTLITALHSIFHATILNHGDGLIFTDTLSWSFGGAVVSVENHGDDRTGQLTFGMLADTMYGVGTFLEKENCWCGEWVIQVAGFGNIGSGFVGAMVDGKVEGEGTLAGRVAQRA